MVLNFSVFFCYFVFYLFYILSHLLKIIEKKYTSILCKMFLFSSKQRNVTLQRLRANFGTIMQGKLLMVCVRRPLN